MGGTVDCKSPLLLSLFFNAWLLQEADVHTVILMCSEEDFSCSFYWGEPQEEVQCHTEQQDPVELEFINKCVN